MERENVPELPLGAPGGKTYQPVSTTVLTSLVVLR